MENPATAPVRLPPSTPSEKTTSATTSGLEPKTSILEKQTTCAMAVKMPSATRRPMIPGVRIIRRPFRTASSGP
jgi:hypothetical protein